MDLELFSASISGTWEALQRVLARYAGHQMQAVYEAGYFGFRLHHRLLAHLLAKGLLKRVWVPSEEKLYHRQVIRRRRQLVRDRVHTQSRIKAELRFCGIHLEEPLGSWTQMYFETLRSGKFGDCWM